MLRIDSADSTRSHVKYMNYVSFPSPPVVAAQVLHRGRSYWFEKHLCTQDSFTPIRLRKTISDQNGVCYDSQQVSSPNV